MTTYPHSIAVLAALTEALRADPTEALAPFRAALEQAQATNTNPPALTYLDAALALARQGPLASLVPPLAELAHMLPWTTFYRETDLTRPFLDKFALLEFVGPNGPVRAPDLVVGLFLLGPQTWYPLHRHAAAEVYTILAGRLRLRMADEWYERVAGEHQPLPPHVPHGLQTVDAPVLMLYTWRGAVRDPVFFIHGEDAIRMPLLPHYTPAEA